jgi:hypothetical protein
MANIKSMIVEVFDAVALTKQVKALGVKPGVKAVLAAATSRGFVPSTDAQQIQGFKRTYKPDVPITENGVSVSKLEYTYLVQELVKRGSGDKAAMVVTTLATPGSGMGVEVDVRFLIAPGGDVTKATEMRYDNATKTVVPTNSWWTRFVACLKGKCGGKCLKALTTCKFTSWVSYLACLALQCGGCSAKCVACATCKGRWWCRWAVGTCRD